MKVTTDKKPITKIAREGIPCSEESLKEHLKAFSDMEECFKRLDKKKK